MSAFISNNRLFYVLPCALLLLFSNVSLAQIVQADSEALQKLMIDGVPIIDIRTEGEWKTTGVIKGSHTLTFFDERGKYDIEKFMTELDKIAKADQAVAFICTIGGRSASVTDLLSKKAGYTSVYNVTQGIRGWTLSGKEVVSYADR